MTSEGRLCEAPEAESKVCVRPRAKVESKSSLMRGTYFILK